MRSRERIFPVWISVWNVRPRPPPFSWAVNEKLAGAFALSDLMRNTTLKHPRAPGEGAAHCDLTGDHKGAAKVIADELGIGEVEGEVLPRQRAEIVKRFENEGRIVAMAGDGINDAPALAAGRCRNRHGTGTTLPSKTPASRLRKGIYAASFALAI